MLVRVTVHFRTDRRENIVSNEHKDDSILLVGTVLISTPALAPAVSVYRLRSYGKAARIWLGLRRWSCDRARAGQRPRHALQATRRLRLRENK
jgi:hypothetical protein